MNETIYKYHGLGNDFIILDRRLGNQDIDANISRWLCDRHRGVGGDGVLVLLRSAVAQAKMVVHNADGSLAQMCGNGVRCVAKYLADRTREHPNLVTIETGAGVLICHLHYENKEVSVAEIEMGAAR